MGTWQRLDNLIVYYMVCVKSYQIFSTTELTPYLLNSFDEWYHICLCHIYRFGASSWWFVPLVGVFKTVSNSSTHLEQLDPANMTRDRESASSYKPLHHYVCVMIFFARVLCNGTELRSYIPTGSHYMTYVYPKGIIHSPKGYSSSESWT